MLNSQASLRRIYVPANIAMLRALAEAGELKSSEPVHMVTAALRRDQPGAADDDLEYTAFADAALASVGLLVGQAPRRVVVSADVPERLLTEHAEGTGADFTGDVKLARVAAIHVDDADAAAEIAAVLDSGEDPDLEAIDQHVLDWYDPSEIHDLLSGFGSSMP